MEPRRKRWTATAAVAVGVFLGGGLSSLAQDATPPTDRPPHAHPAHVHVGTCAELDPNPAFMLADVASAPSPATAGDAATIPVERSATTVDAPLEDLRTGGYAINVHQSAEDIGTYIACGSLGGAIDESGALVVGLGELNGSDHSGVAILAQQGEQTAVTVYLAEGLSGDAGAAAAGVTAADTEAGSVAASVDIEDFVYAPDPVEVPVGATVTWTNSDTVPHTATARDRAVLQSGTLNSGDTFSQTFAEPGSFDYFCEFHANMKGTIVVQ